MTRVRRNRPPVVAVGAGPTCVLEPVEADLAEVEPGDPAELADAARAAAAQAREAAARAVAEAQEQAARLAEAAQREASQLELQARAADAEAARWQEIADRAAAIVGTSAEVETLTSARDGLAQDAAETELEIARLESRLSELAAASNEAAQRRLQAVRNDDAAGLREALTDLGTAAELHQARSADLEAARSRLVGLRSEHSELCGRLGRAALRLVALRRAEAGRPPAEETIATALGLLPALVVSMMQSDPERLNAIMLGGVPPERQPAMREAIRLGPLNPRGLISLASAAAGGVLGSQVLDAVEQIAAADPAQFEALRRLAFAEPAAGVVGGPADDAAGLVASVLAGGAR